MNFGLRHAIAFGVVSAMTGVMSCNVEKGEQKTDSTDHRTHESAHDDLRSEIISNSSPNSDGLNLTGATNDWVKVYVIAWGGTQQDQIEWKLSYTATDMRIISDIYPFNYDDAWWMRDDSPTGDVWSPDLSGDTPRARRAETCYSAVSDLHTGGGWRWWNYDLADSLAFYVHGTADNSGVAPLVMTITGTATHKGSGKVDKIVYSVPLVYNHTTGYSNSTFPGISKNSKGFGVQGGLDAYVQHTKQPLNPPACKVKAAPTCAGKAVGSSQTVACGTGMTGTRTQICTANSTLTAPGTTAAFVDVASSCSAIQCDGQAFNATKTLACPAGTFGSHIQTCQVSGWTDTTNTCAAPTCSGGKAIGATQTLSCPSGQIGSDVQTCKASGSTAVWTETNNSCAAACDGSPVASTRTLACPAGQFGQDIQTCMMNGTVASWSETSNTCAVPSCDGSAVGASRNVSCPAGQIGSDTQTCTLAGSVATWQVTQNTCAAPTCDNSPLDATKTLPCPEGQIGSDVQVCTLSGWTESSNTCVVPGCDGSPINATKNLACPAGQTGVDVQICTLNGWQPSQNTCASGGGGNGDG